MQIINVKVDSESCFPIKAHPTDAGHDLTAQKLLKVYGDCNEELNVKYYSDEYELSIPPHGRVLIGTGVKLELPKGWYADVVSRSGLSLKLGLEVLNSPGIIDANYRGEVGVILHNTSKSLIRIRIGDRIAQLIFHRLDEVDLKITDSINSTDRGEGGFGSTGT